MFRGSSGCISSVIHAARSAPPAFPARMRLEIISEVVEVKTNRCTPAATDASSKFSVPCTFTETNSACG